MRPLSNIYHPEIVPDLSPRVAFNSLEKGQSYVHIPGGKVRTIHRKAPDYTVVMRHDGPDRKDVWFTRIYPDSKAWQSVVIISKSPMINNKNTDQIELFV